MCPNGWDRNAMKITIFYFHGKSSRSDKSVAPASCHWVGRVDDHSGGAHGVEGHVTCDLFVVFRGARFPERGRNSGYTVVYVDVRVPVDLSDT